MPTKVLARSTGALHVVPLSVEREKVTVEASRGSGFYPFPEGMAKQMARLLPTWSVSLFVLLRRSGRPEDFLRALRDGATVDEALQQAYGFDIEGFEDAWRVDIGAPARSGSAARPMPTLVPTIVPTFVPISIANTGPTPAPIRERPTPTPIAIAQANESIATAPAPAIEQTHILPVIIIVIGVVIVATILAAVIIGRRKQRMDV